MKSLTVTIPIPPKELQPNARVCWQAKARAVSKSRLDANMCAMEASDRHTPNWLHTRVLIRWFGKDKRCLKLDKDNIISATKAARDGLTDAGIWIDDNGVNITGVEIEVDKDNPRVELVCECAAEQTK